MKKTPRDFLLARHIAKVPQLDRLRRAILDDATPITVRQIPHELFFPQRCIWIGLAATWLVILSLHFSQRSAVPRLNSSATLYAANWSANQAQLHALLAETNPNR